MTRNEQEAAPRFTGIGILGTFSFQVRQFFELPTIILRFFFLRIFVKQFDFERHRVIINNTRFLLFPYLVFFSY